MTAVDYLLIGHITRDLTPHGDEPGGTVTYSGRAAAALGSHTAVLTSYAPDFSSSQVLAGLTVHNVPSAATTTFENVYTPHGRVQTVHATATTITIASPSSSCAARGAAASPAGPASCTWGSLPGTSCSC